MTSFRPFSALLGAALLSGLAGAQSLYEVDGSGTMTWDEFTGPPAACGYPNGPLIFSAPHIQAAPCVPLNPFGPPPNVLFGDVTDNMIKDLVYVTDGKSVAEYLAATGLQTNVMPVAGVFGTGPLTGLGFNSLANILWITDGATIFGVTPSPAGSCAPPAIVVAPFAHVGPGKATDVAWFPGGGLVLACDAAGFVTGYTPGGVVVIPSYFAGGPCGLGPNLTGIAVDTATGCGGAIPVISLTNGVAVSRQFLGGGAAPPTFYQTAPCTPVPVPLTEGLAYAARPIAYGAGSLGGPVFGAKGQSCLPSPGFALTLAPLPVAAQAWLFVGTAAACPPGLLVGQPLLVNPIVSIIGPIAVSGALTLPSPLPPAGGAIPCGLSVYMQWFVRNSATLAWKSSNGLEMTFALP